MERRNCYKDFVLFTAMVAVECSNVGLSTLFKAATLKGLSYYVLILYSHAIATLVLLPLPFIFRSTIALPSTKFPLLFRICLLGLTGLLCQILGYKGIAYSSPTLASAISNLTPAFTFTLAIIFRMEKLALRSSSTRAKIIGTVISISGAMVVVLYRGPTILSTSITPSLSLQWPLSSSPSDWVVGGVLFAAEFLLVSVWYIIQTQIMKIYPAELVVVFLYNLCATVMAAPVCLMAERNLSAWRIKPDIALTAILYSGFLGSSWGTFVHTFCLRLKGPVYVAIFKPLSIAIAAIMGIIFLHDALHLGSIIGSVIISVGFYAVIWGKAKEGVKKDDTGFTSVGASSDSENPLLHSVKLEDTETEFPHCI